MKNVSTTQGAQLAAAIDNLRDDLDRAIAEQDKWRADAIRAEIKRAQKRLTELERWAKGR